MAPFVVAAFGLASSEPAPSAGRAAARLIRRPPDSWTGRREVKYLTAPMALRSRNEDHSFSKFLRCGMNVIDPSVVAVSGSGKVFTQNRGNLTGLTMPIMRFDAFRVCMLIGNIVSTIRGR